jgi:hypothetical protein
MAPAGRGHLGSTSPDRRRQRSGALAIGSRSRPAATCGWTAPGRADGSHTASHEACHAAGASARRPQRMRDDATTARDAGDRANPSPARPAGCDGTRAATTAAFGAGAASATGGWAGGLAAGALVVHRRSRAGLVLAARPIRSAANRANHLGAGTLAAAANRRLDLAGGPLGLNSHSPALAAPRSEVSVCLLSGRDHNGLIPPTS